jgi:hypothetical protein
MNLKTLKDQVWPTSVWPTLAGSAWVRPHISMTYKIGDIARQRLTFKVTQQEVINQILFSTCNYGPNNR